jgi:hypothetical protein
MTSPTLRQALKNFFPALAPPPPITSRTLSDRDATSSDDDDASSGDGIRDSQTMWPNTVFDTYGVQSALP